MLYFLFQDVFIMAYRRRRLSRRKSARTYLRGRRRHRKNTISRRALLAMRGGYRI